MNDLVINGDGRHPDKVSAEEYAQAGHNLNKSPLQIIRLKCRDCTNNLEAEISHCPISSCPSWPYRMGKSPKARKPFSEAKAAKLKLLKKEA